MNGLLLDREVDEKLSVAARAALKVELRQEHYRRDDKHYRSNGCDFSPHLSCP
jgi:hypothetical protein